MEVSLFLAKAIGICFLIYGISLIISKSTFQLIIKDLINHPASIMLGGTINLVIGVLIILNHNVWEADWTVLITIIGWLLLLRGIIWTTFPSVFLPKIAKLSDNYKPVYISAVIILALGITLCYFGFRSY